LELAQCWVASPDRCMDGLRIENVETDRASHAVAARFPGIFWNERFELSFGPFMLGKGFAVRRKMPANSAQPFD
jgi:hypothetical protein